MLTVASAALILTFTSQPLSPKEFDKLHKQLQPPADERWRTIPWKVSLLDARNLAAKEQKPLFIWAMDGNPLACG